MRNEICSFKLEVIDAGSFRLEVLVTVPVVPFSPAFKFQMYHTV